MPTQLIKRYLEEVARWMRNENSYDDWEVGMEPIPGDKTLELEALALELELQMTDLS